jgi:hypothetical protein
VLPEHDGPTHPYVGASAACWALYGEVLAREYGELGYPECHPLTGDAYAVQHPGRREPRSIQSVGLHLCALYLAFERGEIGPHATALREHIHAAKPRFQWLTMPVPNGTLTIYDVLQTEGEQEHCDTVERWGRSVWEAWEIHHDTVRGWVEPILDRVES